MTKVNKIKIHMNDLDLQEVMLKLPLNNDELTKLLVTKNIADSEHLGEKYFDEEVKSVKKTEIRNFSIHVPTNIYYLNSYFLALKEKDLDVPEEQIEITTDKLKELLADIYELSRKDMTLAEMHEELKAPPVEEKIEKPTFSIYQLQADHKERKREKT